MKVQCPNCKTLYEMSGSNISAKGLKYVCPKCQTGFNFKPNLKATKDTSAEYYSYQPRNRNPWFTMWIKPRATIQQIVDTNPERLVLLLAAAAGFSQSLNSASTRSIGDSLEWPMIFVYAAIVGPILGIFTLYVGSALIRWTGNWIGGQASSQDIRAAMAWSNIPIIWSLILWIPEFVLFGQDLFTTEMPSIDANPSLAFILLGFAAIETIAGIWTIVLFIICLGQVQRFSAWKALGNAILSVLVIFVPLVIIFVGIASLNRF